MEVKELLAKAGLNPRGTVVTQTREAVLVINNRACEGFMGCRALLPVILPVGYTLTVYGPGYHEVFKGGKKWPS
ncbi:DddA-like double-stranded DNA deaminase toxin [Actinokineospora pegani]|uniref:DddA-like double-stranded DNA deaminase toxin n=1 Tax=Actinokineospora pegani TaxID=2654637 RepID=UPI0012E9B0AA|nr:DddA-like double-stranded DNA deaminase toxin [Actinokineospora pegani]